MQKSDLWKQKKSLEKLCEKLSLNWQGLLQDTDDIQYPYLIGLVLLLRQEVVYPRISFYFPFFCQGRLHGKVVWYGMVWYKRKYYCSTAIIIVIQKL